MSRVVIVPGLAVRGYALPSARAIAARGHRVSLTAAPTWRGVPARLDRFGQRLAADLEARSEDVDLLIGMSVGTQVAGVAAAGSERIRRLLLLGAMVDPRIRGYRGRIGAWRSGDTNPEAPDVAGSMQDWARAGVARIALGFDSSLRVRLEDVLPRVGAATTIVHAELDNLGSRGWAEQLARASGGRLVERARALHSWPVTDPEGLADLVDGVLEDGVLEDSAVG